MDLPQQGEAGPGACCFVFEISRLWFALQRGSVHCVSPKVARSRIRPASPFLVRSWTRTAARPGTGCRTSFRFDAREVAPWGARVGRPSSTTEEDTDQGAAPCDPVAGCPFLAIVSAYSARRWGAQKPNCVRVGGLLPLLKECDASECKKFASHGFS
jgi:hypothetical protein